MSQSTAKLMSECIHVTSSLVCVFSMYLFGMWQKKKQQRYFGERMGKQTAAHTQSFRNCVFQNLTFLKHLKKNITITSFSICNPKVLKRAAKQIFLQFILFDHFFKTPSVFFLRTPTAFVFVRHVAETAEDTSEGQCVYILKTPRPASLRLAGRSCLRQLVSLEKNIKKILFSETTRPFCV